ARNRLRRRLIEARAGIRLALVLVIADGAVRARIDFDEDLLLLLRLERAHHPRRRLDARAHDLAEFLHREAVADEVLRRGRIEAVRRAALLARRVARPGAE